MFKKNWTINQLIFSKTFLNGFETSTSSDVPMVLLSIFKYFFRNLAEKFS